MFFLILLDSLFWKSQPILKRLILELVLARIGAQPGSCRAEKVTGSGQRESLKNRY